MLILSFGWTWPAFVARAKRVTRRQWKRKTLLAHQNAFERKEPVQAWDKVPHAGGQRIGLLRYTERPYLEKLGKMPDSDYEAEGFEWFNMNPKLIPEAALHQKWASAGGGRLEGFRIWREELAEEEFVVLRFQILEVLGSATLRLADEARKFVPK